LFYGIVAILALFICFVIYSQNKKKEIMNRAQVAELKANLKTEFLSTISHELRTPL
jgi:signal transduction histidine kinase